MTTGVSDEESNERRVVVVRTDWSNLSTVLETKTGPLCPLDCQTGDLSLTALEDQGLAVSGGTLYLADINKLTNTSQLCLQDQTISIVLEESGEEKECSRWCSRWGHC